MNSSWQLQTCILLDVLSLPFIVEDRLHIKRMRTWVACAKMRENLSLGLRDWTKTFKVMMSKDILQAGPSLWILALLQSLVNRHATSRPTPSTLPSHSFFSSLPISTLNFLDRSNFTAKTRGEKVSFMKGLTGVLDRFSEGLRMRKILPSLLEEVSFPRPPSHQNG